MRIGRLNCSGQLYFHCKLHSSGVFSQTVDSVSKHIGIPDEAPQDVEPHLGFQYVLNIRFIVQKYGNNKTNAITFTCKLKDATFKAWKKLPPEQAYTTIT